MASFFVPMSFPWNPYNVEIVYIFNNGRIRRYVRKEDKKHEDFDEDASLSNFLLYVFGND